MIELDEFEFPAKDYFRIVCWQRTVRSLWVWAYLTVFFYTFYGIIGNDVLFPTVVSVCFMMFLLATAYFTGRSHAYSKTNCAILQKRRMSFGDGKYHIACTDGTEGQGPLDHIHMAYILCGYYCLFVNSMNYYAVPLTAFRSEEDRMRFETEILSDKLKKGLLPWKRIVVFLIVSALMIGLTCLLRNPEYIETLKNERQQPQPSINCHADL